MEHAQQTLKKLAAQAHGEALTHLLTAWEKRDATQLPSAQDLGGRVSASVRAAWAQALQAWAGDAAAARAMAHRVPLPPRVEEEAFFYEALYKRSLHMRDAAQAG